MSGLVAKIQTPAGLSRNPHLVSRADRGKTVTKPFVLDLLELPLSEKQIPQVVENLESGGKPKGALERAAMRPRQVRYQAALSPDIAPF
ncbi:MAG: hypothetical protein ABI995_00600 [Acidobacteriota bacterium]